MEAPVLLHLVFDEARDHAPVIRSTISGLMPDLAARLRTVLTISSTRAGTSISSASC